MTLDSAGMVTQTVDEISKLLAPMQATLQSTQTALQDVTTRLASLEANVSELGSRSGSPKPPAPQDDFVARATEEVRSAMRAQDESRAEPAVGGPRQTLTTQDARFIGPQDARLTPDTRQGRSGHQSETGLDQFHAGGPSASHAAPARQLSVPTVHYDPTRYMSRVEAVELQRRECHPEGYAPWQSQPPQMQGQGPQGQNEAHPDPTIPAPAPRAAHGRPPMANAAAAEPPETTVRPAWDRDARVKSGLW